MGFLQIHPDETLPETRLPGGGLREFLIPEKYLSLKLFFDNLRNYAICAAFTALGAWVWTVPVATSFVIVWPWMPSAAAILIWVVSAAFLALNCGQTWLLTRELTSSMRIIRASRFYVYGPRSHWTMFLAIGHGIYSLASELLFSLLATLMSVVLIGISIGFVAYAVLVRQIGGG